MNLLSKYSLELIQSLRLLARFSRLSQKYLPNKFTGVPKKTNEKSIKGQDA